MRPLRHDGILGALLALDVALFAVAVWLGPAHVLDGSGAVTNGYLVAGGIAATLAIVWSLGLLPLDDGVVRRLRIYGLAAQALHATGHLARLYYTFWWYDDLLHFGLILALSLALQEVVAGWRLAGFQPPAWRVALLVGLAGFTAAGAWELFEWSGDKLFGTREQDNLDDTMIDMIDGLAGAAIAAGIVWRRVRARRLKADGERAEIPRV